MKDKQQIIKYINGIFCDTINECYLKNGWHVVSIHPATSKDNVGAYVVLEKEIPTPPIDYPLD